MTDAFISWKDFYSVGCRELDDQHKAILRIINDLYLALQSEREHQVIKGLLDRLVQYAMDHFRREEELMKECGYPELARHRAAHKLLTEQTLDFREHFCTVTGKDLLVFLKKWWVNHICETDKQYGPYLEAVPTG